MLAFIIDNQSAIRLAALLAIVALVGCWEMIWPRRARAISKSIRWTNNWLISTLNALLLPVVFPVLAVGVALIAQRNHWGLFNVIGLPDAIGIPLFVLLFDCAIYWQHRLYHVVPALWRLHRMHHADPDFDVSTGIRFHPVSILLSMVIKMAVVIALGPSPVAVLVSEILLNVSSMFNHGNIYISPKVDRYLRLFLVTPDVHRVHHSVKRHEMNSNFGFNFPWWDRLFGTYRAQPEAGHEAMEIGIRGFQASRDQMLDRLLLHPFLKR